LLDDRKAPVGPTPDEAAPPGAIVLATIASAPLSQIVEAMLPASDDWIAELPPPSLPCPINLPAGSRCDGFLYTCV